MVNTIVKSDGSNVITYIKDFQIVNGGQTTASILYARDGLKCDLAEVFAQVKLSVVEEKNYLKSFRKFQNTPTLKTRYHLPTLLRTVRRKFVLSVFERSSCAQKAGALHASKWFYERARGQYKSMLAYKTQSQRNKIESEFPKSQLIEKTDLAKFEFAFDGRPHHVSEGAQKCFGRYIATSLKSSADNAELTDTWFKCAVAKGILFRRLDKEVALSDWYKNDKGLKAQTVAYAVSACAHAFREMGQQIDLLRIWREQDVPTVLLDWMVEQAHVVHGILNKPPGIVKNPTEFCKKEFCWTLHVKGKISNPSLKVLDYGVAISEFSEEQMRGKRDARRDNELDFEIALAKLVPRAAEIRTLAESKLLLSENNTRALTKLETGRLTFTKSEKTHSRHSLID